MMFHKVNSLAWETRSPWGVGGWCVCVCVCVCVCFHLGTCRCWVPCSWTYLKAEPGVGTQWGGASFPLQGLLPMGVFASAPTLGVPPAISSGAAGKGTPVPLGFCFQSSSRLLPGMGLCLAPAMLLLLLGSPSSAARNRCLDAAEACTADARCQRLRTEYVAQCLGRAASGGCPRARCRSALRRFFARGPPALTHALLFCPCVNAACAERRRQTFVPACAFAGPGPAPPSCLAPLDACEHSRICRPRLLAFQASCAPAPSAPDGCLQDQGPRCLRAYAGLVGTAVTPNYVDNASARVAPWCDCGASGNRREECEAFRGLFTRNRCLEASPCRCPILLPHRRMPEVSVCPRGAGPCAGVSQPSPPWTPSSLDGAIQAFDAGWPPVLQDRPDVHQDPEHSLLQSTFCSHPQGVLRRWAPGWELPALHAPSPGSAAPALTRTADLGQHHCPILPGVQGPICTLLPH
uniref:GDNF family receptor alpha-4 isoform X3 n=1 Tax=Halichoerus grypus TaxID=9711 RepID=UPI0016590974|nr:GDNF family receptor alpha-4 isoform X3 [Halichoerus grypus]